MDVTVDNWRTWLIRNARVLSLVSLLRDAASELLSPSPAEPFDERAGRRCRRLSARREAPPRVDAIFGSDAALLAKENAPPGMISKATFAGNTLNLELFDSDKLGAFTR